MHIALIRTEFIARRGGAERYAVNLARRWRDQGHRISIICHKADADDAAGMEIVHVSRPKMLGPFKHGWFASRAGKAAQKLGADAVLCLARAYPGDVLRLGDGLHCEWMKARYSSAALQLQRMNPRHRQLLKLEAELFRPGRFAHYVANSEMMRGIVMENFGVRPQTISVIPNGVDFKRFNLEARGRRSAVRKELGISDGAQLVLFAGMDLRRKGLRAVIDGFIELAKNDSAARLLCVGKGETEDAREYLRAADLDQRVRFLPPTDRMADFYAAADVFVLPTLHDPSANAVTEALACGLPVVTSADNGAKQHIVNDVNGYVLKDRRDAREFAAAVGDLIAKPRKPENIRDAGKLIGLEENADRLLECLVRSRQEVAA
ncbi:MAG: glycosyltransferase family 4 protein [Planctomycetes bacterium]|nr:glycosyltransferase family 4 protein [Planctomycetota bacterium]